MIIDFHTHTFPPHLAASTLAKLSSVAHIPPWTDGTSEGLLTSMEGAGVDLSVILPVATNPRQVPGVNDASVRLNEALGNRGLLSFGCIHPDYENWREELRRIAALGLKGIKLHPVYQGTDIDDPRYLRILELAGELGLIVVTHSGVDIGFPGEDRCSPAMMRHAVEQVGPVILVAAHMGGWKRWREAEEQLAGTAVYLDTAFSTGTMTPLQDSHYEAEELELLDQERFLHMVRTFGPGRLLFGTDSPWSGQKESINWLKELPLPQEELDAILGKNAEQLLHIH